MAREALLRKKLSRFLESDAPAWMDADLPELANGAAAWVRALRQESDVRQANKRRRGKR